MLNRRDQRDLRWLEIAHYVAAGMVLLMTIFQQVVWGLFDDMAPSAGAAGRLPLPALMRSLVLAAIAFQGSFVVTCSAVGLLLRRRKGYRTCFVLSIWNCLLFPYGTAPAVFTFLLLRRPAIEAEFTGREVAAPPAVEPAPPIDLRALDVESRAAERQLQSLSVFHYVLAGVTFLFGLFPLIHVTFGIMLLTRPELLGDSKGADPRLFGLVFLGVGLMFVITSWVLAVATVLAGRFIASRRRHGVCLAVAALNCIFFPFGTALGVYTLIVLNRPPVEALFASD